jgi:amino acid adenylation domain-containing protein
MHEIGGVVAAGQVDLRSIPSRIAMHASAEPEKIALRDAARPVTYAELERESNALAAQLRNAGAGSERCVGIFLGRSAEFVVAALAILKTGAAYLPLDPSTPTERVLSIFGDAGLVAVVTDSRNADGVSGLSCPMLTIDRLDGTGAGSTGRIEVDPCSLAYVIYTSGSTGQPKGVEVTHASLCNLISWHQAAFGVTAADRASQVAGLGFDAAGWEIWPYLTAGASLHIADELTRRSPEMLRDWFVSQRITIGFVPTVLAEQLFRIDWPSDAALRLLLTGGDSLSRRPPARLPFAVVNNYGPTECTVVATSGTVSSEDDSPERPSIGRPIWNVTALVLDETLRPVGRGESGELCIGGAPVARGYRSMPELTARHFVTYITPSGEPLRLYRTGDRVRMRQDGEFDFLGRSDEQVKIRGYRIELGEIEARVSRFPGIAAATVAVIETSGAGAALAAYVVPAANARLTEDGLREYLAANLPDYMVPAFFVVVGELPVMANGKLDKAALPSPCAENLLAKAPADSGAQNSLEERVASLVASLMGRSIGADENFFMIGGHSMFGVQLVARIRETFGVKLPLRHVFTAPTVRELSNEVARLTGAYS